LLQNSRNVLVSSSASSQCGMVAKLADLGLSRVLQQHKTHRTTQTVGEQAHFCHCQYCCWTAHLDVHTTLLACAAAVTAMFTAEQQL
jgi:hypothetical protein